MITHNFRKIGCISQNPYINKPVELRLGPRLLFQFFIPGFRLGPPLLAQFFNFPSFTSFIPGSRLGPHLLTQLFIPGFRVGPPLLAQLFICISFAAFLPGSRLGPPYLAQLFVPGLCLGPPLLAQFFCSGKSPGNLPENTTNSARFQEHNMHITESI